MDTTEKLREIIKRGYLAINDTKGMVTGRLELSEKDILVQRGPDLKTVVDTLYGELLVEKAVEV